MHTKLFGIVLTCTMIFSMLMSVSTLSTFPPEGIYVDVSSYFSTMHNLIWIIPNIQGTYYFSWSSIMIIIVTITLGVLAPLIGIFVIAGVITGGAVSGLPLKYIVQLILGFVLSVAIGTTLYLQVQAFMPSWLHMLFIFIPCGLLIYSVLDIGGD